MKKPYPSKISPTPIISAATEIKFDISCPAESVFGLVYPILKENYEKYETFPIVNIPEQIRVQNGLMEQPHYRFYSETIPYNILLGPNVFVFVYTKETPELKHDYPGWSEFIVVELQRLYQKLFDLKIISNVKRLGIRYSDFFENINIFDHTGFNLVDSNNSRKDNLPTQIIQTTEKENVLSNIVVSNNANFVSAKGSIIDIDSFITSFEKDFMEDYKHYLSLVHEINKEFFYEMLKQEFVDTLNPQYGEENAN